MQNHSSLTQSILLIEWFESQISVFWYENQPKGKYGTDYLDDQDQSKENSFLNSWFESLHKRFDQYHLNDSSMQVLNTRMCKESLALNKAKIEIIFLIPKFDV